MNEEMNEEFPLDHVYKKVDFGTTYLSDWMETIDGKTFTMGRCITKDGNGKVISDVTQKILEITFE